MKAKDTGKIEVILYGSIHSIYYYKINEEFPGASDNFPHYPRRRHPLAQWSPGGQLEQ
jgi:hypothetical protein